jgi:hypothetical protein
MKKNTMCCSCQNLLFAQLSEGAINHSEEGTGNRLEVGASLRLEVPA